MLQYIPFRIERININPTPGPAASTVGIKIAKINGIYLCALSSMGQIKRGVRDNLRIIFRKIML